MSPVWIGDGGTATALQKMGLPIGSAPESWTLTHPEAVVMVARKYRNAGADFVLTNTFGANRFRLEGSGLEPEVDRLNRSAVELAREGISGSARSGRGRVYGSIGPTGLEPAEVASNRTEIARVLTAQIEALARAGVDGLVVETSMSAMEAAIALKAARAARLETIVSFACCVVGREARTLGGDSLDESFQKMRDSGAHGLGVNCVAVREIESVVGLFPTDIPIWLKPNAGIPETVASGLACPDMDEEMVSALSRFEIPNLAYVGGCCGTGVSFTERLRQSMGGR